MPEDDLDAPVIGRHPAASVFFAQRSLGQLGSKLNRIGSWDRIFDAWHTQNSGTALPSVMVTARDRQQGFVAVPNIFPLESVELELPDPGWWTGGNYGGYETCNDWLKYDRL